LVVAALWAKAVFVSAEGAAAKTARVVYQHQRVRRDMIVVLEENLSHAMLERHVVNLV
jgi:hypothetical protein